MDPIGRRHVNQDNVIIFPGVNSKRDVELQSFLFRPIDSRDPFIPPPAGTISPVTNFRASAPSDAVRRDWEERMQRIRANTRLARRRPISQGVPSIAVRELTQIQDARRPLHKAAEASAIRPADDDLTVRDSKLPKLRTIPAEYALARLP
jgi:hypothetical protein